MSGFNKRIICRCSSQTLMVAWPLYLNALFLPLFSQYSICFRMLDKPRQSLDDLIHQLNVISAEEFDTEVAKVK